MARAGKFVIKTGRGGKTHFVLLASIGRLVVTSETYESKASCLKGIDAVKRLAGDAAVDRGRPRDDGCGYQGATHGHGRVSALVAGNAGFTPAPRFGRSTARR